MIERYCVDEMNTIWSDNNKFKTWLNIEIYTCEAFNKLGIIPDSDLKKIQENANFNLEKIYELEKITKHDVVAFTRNVSEYLGNEKKWIHFGLTSTDVVDTSYGFLYSEANKLIENALINFIDLLKEKALKYKYTVQMGRTHGVHAELTTFGMKLAIYYDEMNRNLKRFKDARKNIEVGKISGAVGTYANIDPFVQDYVCNKLNINSSLISTQTLQRDRHAQYVTTLSIIASSFEKIAVELRHLQRTEVREVMENFKKGQKGSSAMPHKKNPISSENITGISRVIKGYIIPALENVPLWHERDISHSSAERIIMPDITNLTLYMINKMTNIIQNLYVDEEMMTNNISITNNVFFSQKILLTLIDKGLSREKAYDLIQPIAIESFNRREDFKINIYPHVKNYFTKKEFENCFNITYHLDKIDFVFKRLGINND